MTPSASPGSPHEPQQDSFPTARIREAALVSFAEKGVAATSLRAVAQAAGVSLGLVQHHFGTKDRLRAAVDEHVLEVVANAVLAAPEPGDTSGDPLAELGHRVTSIQVTHPAISRYVARAVIDGDEIALTVFDNLVALAAGQWRKFDEQSLLRPGIDRQWAVLHAVILIFGTVMLERALDRHLPEPLMTAQQLTRWDNAMAVLLRDGLFRDATD